MRDVKDIKYLVFKGGGVLGAAYAGALKVLEDNNLLNNIEGVAGTSAGSIMSALISFNYNAKEIKEIIDGKNFKQFKDGKIDSSIRLVRKYGLYKGKNFLEWMTKLINQKTKKGDITFGEMASGKYGNFKALKVYATNLDTMDLTEFSAKNTPNVVVVEAIRASMSIPLFFKAWRISKGVPDTDTLYVDGGAVYNYPIQAYHDLNSTLGFFLTTSKEVKPLRYGKLLSYVKRVFKTVLKAQTIDFKEDLQEVYDTVFIDSQGISATDFEIGSSQKEALFNEGVKQTEAYLKERTNAIVA